MQKVTAACAILFGACSLICGATVSANPKPSECRPQSENTPGGQAGNPSLGKTAHKAGKRSAASREEPKSAEKGKDMRLTGWVKEESGKTIFVSDKGKQSWDIANPDAVKGHEGHHVKVKAKLDEAGRSMTIDTVAMMHAGKQAKKEGKASK